MITVLIVILLLMVLGLLPNTGFTNFGYGPSGLFGLILLVVIILALTGRL